jgi:hypothetical protein
MATKKPKYPVLTQQQCLQFLANPSVNPVDPTKKLYAGRGPHADYVRQCEKYKGTGQIGTQSPITSGYGLSPFGIPNIGLQPSLGFPPPITNLPPPTTGLPSLGLPPPITGLPSLGLPPPITGLPNVGFQSPTTGIPSFSLSSPITNLLPPPTTGLQPLAGLSSISITPVPSKMPFAGIPSLALPAKVPTISPRSVGQNVIVIYHTSDSNDIYFIPVNDETAELVQDLLSINGLYRGKDRLTTDQDLIFENLEGDLIDYLIKDLRRLVNLNGVTIINIGDDAEEGTITGLSSTSSSEEY